ncbi:MAG: DUF393 domain-containing protein, partial [Geminicoccaceae bacterium]|nr:DUF393 domain-containing protein [Geminicoccaceae bacterium]
MNGPSIFYNGSCPVCRREIDHYRRAAQRAGVAFDWRDVSSDPDALRAAGLDPEIARRRLHATDERGHLLAGIPAFQRIWERLPGFRWLARLTRRPLIGPLAG